ncbi:hypothetical protein FRB99_001324, partial [Tulasnella sp. 403]
VVQEFHDQLQKGNIHMYIAIYKGNADQKAANHLKMAIGQLKAINLVAEIKAEDYIVKALLKEGSICSN